MAIKLEQGFIHETMENEKDFDYINQLPDELLEKIFELLNSVDLVEVASVCQRFKVLSLSERIWRTRSVKFCNFNDDAEYAIREAEFMKIITYAPSLKKIEMEDRDISHIFPDCCLYKKVKVLSLVRLPSLFQCFDVDFLEEIHVKYVDRRSLEEILKLPKLRKLYVVLFLEDCVGHQGRRLAEGPSCLEVLLVKLANHEILCNLIESHCNSLIDIEVFVNPEEGPKYFMDKVLMCPNLKTLSISCVRKIHLLKNITTLCKLALWPDPNIPFHAEYLPCIPTNIEDLTLCSWAAEDIEEDLEAIIQCCKRIHRLGELRIFMSYHIKELCNEQLETLRSALPALNITCLEDEEELFSHT